jgi:mono/diheme cytochrome c family protein
MLTVCLAIAVSCLYIVGVGFAAGEDPTLEFGISDRLYKTLRLSDLKAKLAVEQVDFMDPQHGKQKRYEAFKLQDVLDVAFGDQWRTGDWTEVVFTALDGYQAVAGRDHMLQPGGFLTFKDLDVEAGWEPIGRRKANPGPFYLVWTGAEQTTQHEFPWPWQVVRISILRFEERFPLVYPAGATVDSAAFQGFQLFKGRCMRCHAMNGQGGKIGPDLNAPMSIVDYRSQNMIKAFIHQPSKYRHTHMPDHLDLTESDLDNLLDYFWYMSKRKHR